MLSSFARSNRTANNVHETRHCFQQCATPLVISDGSLPVQMIAWQE